VTVTVSVSDQPHVYQADQGCTAPDAFLLAEDELTPLRLVAGGGQGAPAPAVGMGEAELATISRVEAVEASMPSAATQAKIARLSEIAAAVARVESARRSRPRTPRDCRLRRDRLARDLVTIDRLRADLEAVFPDRLP
jgi:hypothetical protein